MLKACLLTTILSSFLLLTACESCDERKQKCEALTTTIEAFKSETGSFPSNLTQLDESKVDKALDGLEINYRADSISFDIKFQCVGGVYWFNSGNDYWDFLDSEQLEK
jgi:hypothetical protein